MDAILRSECTRPEAYTLPWTELTSEQALVWSCLRTKGKLTKMSEIHGTVITVLFSDLSISHATVCTQASDQSAQIKGLYIVLD
jgi:hypothetical protein